ncbi:hypothetical protein SAMN05421665_0592 [Yoonia rosea]|uniref:Transferrin-binding protein B C-lobe/N-lobe beta-barrel domain-containing protein n=1 Tax=Yoonia rosea TaxID=287098 RepID=A0A1R3WHY1_9RHOB|nr:transferrin-binding protein-like solute binding protein [Yoonia rosea]SIT77537.1 hypothetical protein SAMN05421665_0592 [Yoonia rosea]
MMSHLAKPLSVFAFLALTACGGGGGGGDTGGGGGGGGGSSSDNGLPFGAVSGQDLSDAEGVRVTTETASGRFTSSTFAEIAPASITVNTNFFTGDSDGNLGPLDGTIEILGETRSFTNGTGTLSTGEVINVIYEPNRTGNHVAAIEVAVSDQNGISGAAAYLIGFETNPDTIAQTGGTTTYVGNFQVTGEVSGTNTESEYDGGITVDVNFLDNDADFTLLGNFNGSQVMNMEGNGLDLTGNSISGELMCTSGCSNGQSLVDATFYGPNAEELGGVLAIGVFVAGQGVYDGVGTFILPTE